MERTLNLKKQRNDSEKGIHLQLTKKENEEECNRDGRKDGEETRRARRHGRKEDKCRRRNADEKSREHVERRRCKGRKNKDEMSRNVVRNEGGA